MSPIIRFIPDHSQVDDITINGRDGLALTVTHDDTVNLSRNGRILASDHDQIDALIDFLRRPEIRAILADTRRSR